MSNIKSCRAKLAALFACCARKVDCYYLASRKLWVALVVWGVVKYNIRANNVWWWLVDCPVFSWTESMSIIYIRQALFSRWRWNQVGRHGHLYWPLIWQVYEVGLNEGDASPILLLHLQFVCLKPCWLPYLRFMQEGIWALPSFCWLSYSLDRTPWSHVQTTENSSYEGRSAAPAARLPTKLQRRNNVMERSGREIRDGKSRKNDEFAPFPNFEKLVFGVVDTVSPCYLEDSRYNSIYPLIHSTPYLHPNPCLCVTID